MENPPSDLPPKEIGSFNPNKTVRLTPEEELLWSKMVGNFVLNFSQMEWVIFCWIKHLNPSKLDKNIFSMPLAEKITKIMPVLIANSKIPAAKHPQVMDLWNEVKMLSNGIRNPVCHHPIVSGKSKSGKDIWGIIDPKRATGIGPMKVPLISIGEIEEASARIAHLSHKLTLILADAYPGHNPLDGAPV
jgi:hypothetical protein